MFLLLLIYHCQFYFLGQLFHVSGAPSWILRPLKASTSSEPYPDYVLFLSLARSFVFGVVALVQRGLRFKRAFFTLRCFLSYTHSPHGACTVSTCFYEGLPGSRQFFLEGCRAFHYGSKQDPVHLLFCLTQSFTNM